MCAAEDRPEGQYRRIGITVGVGDRVPGRRQPEVWQPLAGDPDGLGGQIRDRCAAAGWDGPAVGVDAEEQTCRRRSGRPYRSLVSSTNMVGRAPSTSYTATWIALVRYGSAGKALPVSSPGVHGPAATTTTSYRLLSPGVRQLTDPSGWGTSPSTGPVTTRLFAPRASCSITSERSWSGLMKPARFSSTPTVPSGRPCQPRRRSASRRRSRWSPGAASSTSATAASESGVRREQVRAPGLGVAGLVQQAGRLEQFGQALDCQPALLRMGLEPADAATGGRRRIRPRYGR